MQVFFFDRERSYFEWLVVQNKYVEDRRGHSVFRYVDIVQLGESLSHTSL